MSENGTEGEETRHTPSHVAEELQNSLKWLVRFTVILYLIFAALGYYVWQQGNDTNSALCAYRADLQARVTQSLDYLKDHPNGSKALGITREQLLVNIANQNRVIKAFSGLSCDTASAAETTTTPKERSP